MIVSRCCKEKVWVQCGHEGASYYVCGKCDVPCDTVSALSWMSESYDDSRHVGETQEISSCPRGL